ncbi:hypothetical protein ACX0G9_10215 [Flavitalea flava]
MLKRIAICLFIGQLLCVEISFGQSVESGQSGQAASSASGDESVSGKVFSFPSRLLDRIQHKTADLNQQLTRQTEKYLEQMTRREDRIRKKLYRIDSTGTKNLFAHSSEQYAALAQKLKTDTGNRSASASGEYQPYTDSLRSTLGFLQANPQLLQASVGASVNPQLQRSVNELQALQAKLQDADQIKQYIRDRKEQISQYLSRYNNLPSSLTKEVQGMNQSLFYYSQQVREYRELLNSPNALEQKALTYLNQLPAFQDFMKKNGALAGLFGLPSGYGDPQGLVGLQTRDQISQLIQSQVAAGGAGGAAALQANLQSAQGQLDGYKDKLNQLGGGSGDLDMPNFKPNDQKIKALWKRLEYGTNFQTSRNNQYYPTVVDLGLTIGYRLGHGNSAGIGASYKVGLGNGWNHIAFSSNGLGIRSFIDVKIKASFFISGGFEYNYTTPFSAVQQLRNIDNWTKSGLIGVSKTVSVKSRVFKKTKLSLLWDMLSYSQRPQTQPVVFRVGYGF